MTDLDDELRRALTPAPREPAPERVAAVRAAASDIRPDRRRAVALRAGLAAAAVVALAVIGGLLLRGGPDGVREYDGPIAGVGSDLAGSLEIRKTGIGRVVTLRTDDLEILPDDEFYELWFVGPGDGEGVVNRISAGTFHPDSDGRTDVRLAAAVDPTRYPVVAVTAEPGDGDPAPDGPDLLRVEIN